MSLASTNAPTISFSILATNDIFADAGFIVVS
jgi:hypothetical protein